MNYNPDHKYAIGVDVGGSHLTSAVIDLDTTELVTEPLVTAIDSNGPADSIIAGFADNLNGTLEAAGFPVYNIGFAFPGPFDYKNGICLIKGVQKFESIYGYDMGKTIRPLLNVDDKDSINFKFVNDASGFALGESFAGAGKGYGRVMALTLGTGVGSGFVVNGNLDESSENVPKNGEVYWMPFEDTIVDDSFSTRWFVRRWGQLTGGTISGAKDVTEQLGINPASAQIMDEYGRRLAEFFVPVFDKFKADVLILGGNISRNYPYFKDSLLRQLGDRKIEINLSTLRDKAAMLGAASLFIS